MDLRHCVIPAAGLGTRFLPATKAVPKELLPVLDRPVIQWAVEEAVAAGATDVVLVLAEGKESVAHHLLPDPNLERMLEERGKRPELEAVRAAGHLADISIVIQPEPRGLGDAVLCAADVVGDRPFMCMLPDDLSVADPPVLTQLWRAYELHRAPVIALSRVARSEISRYGVVAIGETRGRDHRVTACVEKPRPEDAPSDLAIMGRYILTPGIFDALRQTRPGALGEVQLTDAIGALAHSGAVWGVEYEGALLDVGTPAGWLATNIRLARDDPALGDVVRSALAAAPA